VRRQAGSDASSAAGSDAFSEQTPERAAIAGYTPANYIFFSEVPEHSCSHNVSVSVSSSPTACYDLFQDWSRLVEFFDMVAQARLAWLWYYTQWVV
jgi:hypothetical protein